MLHIKYEVVFKNCNKTQEYVVRYRNPACVFPSSEKKKQENNINIRIQTELFLGRTLITMQKSGVSFYKTTCTSTRKT